MACVQAEEADRINQFVFQEDAKRSLVSERMLVCACVCMHGNALCMRLYVKCNV